MALKADLQHLDNGNPPTEPSPFATLILEGLAEHLTRDDHREVAFGRTFRASAAGSCSRKIAYQAVGAEVTNPSPAESRWVMQLGTEVHALVANLVARDGDPVSTEVEVDFLDTLGIDGSAHADIVFYDENDIDQVLEVVELKTVNGFGFKKMIGSRGPAEGPRTSAFLQAGLAAMALGAPRFTLVYLATEVMSAREADKVNLPGPLPRIAATWSYETADVADEIQAEVLRVRGILHDVEAHPAGYLDVARYVPLLMPPDAVITNVERSMWTTNVDNGITDSGEVWGGSMCSAYCGYYDTCLSDQRAGS